MADELHNYIDGAWADAADGTRFDVTNPATGEVIATAPDSKREDVDRAVAAARRTFDGGSWWPRTSERERGRILLRAGDIVRRELERLAQLETLDAGKPVGEAREDIAEVAFMFEYYGGWATKIHGEIPPVGPDALSLVVKEPVGVAAAITPWNYPMMMAVQKVAPALAAGCTVILKPAEQTPLTALEIPRIMEEAGLPTGVLHVLTGFGETAGGALVEDPRVDKVGFTGSRDVGKIIMRTGANTLKRVTLELGGKSPNIVFADADFDAAIEGSCNGIFWNQGDLFGRLSGVRAARHLRRRAGGHDGAGERGAAGRRTRSGYHHGAADHPGTAGAGGALRRDRLEGGHAGRDRRQAERSSPGRRLLRPAHHLR
jgi:acyl-CoA reductase-like NAD-dependent aldehyde dehydrogenase